MGATAVAARIVLPAARRNGRAVACCLAFDESGGSLVAVCGLVGGSGCSTLAYNLARQAARESKKAVLLTESDSGRAGLAVLAGQATPHSLRNVARELAGGDAPRASFVELEPRLRLLASLPQPQSEAEPEDLRPLLREAREAHGLVIVDCGAGWATAGSVLTESTHIIWTLPASPMALARARVLLASDALPAPGRWREALAVSALDQGPRASVRALRRLAAPRCDRLVLCPYSHALAKGEVPEPDEGLLRALSGVASFLRRAA
jgi:hypothetical protein